jgi:ornithine carbamoyltransferase
MKLVHKDLISIADLTKHELNAILGLTAQFKNGEIQKKSLEGKSAAMIFEKPSTRTRVSFEVAIYELGGYPVVLKSNEIQLSRGESVADTARILSGYVDAVVIRANSHENVKELAANASIPVINALSDKEHPCQILADLFTILMNKGFNGTKVVFVGDGDNNVTNSLVLACSILGMPVSVSSPIGYEIKNDVITLAKKLNAKCEIELVSDPKKAVIDADVIYSDVWISMGAEKEKAKRLEDFKSYQINEQLLSNIGKDDYLVMHCLPAHRGEEITDGVIDGKNSVVWEQAENRLYAQKAVLSLLLNNEK